METESKRQELASRLVQREVRYCASTLTLVTDDEWADFVSDFRTYHTEEVWRTGYSIMYSRLSGGEKHGAVIAEVHYLPNGKKEYFILKGLKP